MINGDVMPFCQRCTGVYLGLGITFIYLLLTRYYRRGSPSGGILLTNLASIAVMVVFGYHILDPGARWRLWSGLIFGNAVAWLVFPSAWELWAQSDCTPRSPASGFWLLFVFLNTIPLWFTFEWKGAGVLVDALALAGLIGAAGCAAAVLGFGLKKGVRNSLLLLKGMDNEKQVDAQARCE